MALRCTSCGGDLEAGDRFCPWCAKAVQGSATGPVEPPPFVPDDSRPPPPLTSPPPPAPTAPPPPPPPAPGSRTSFTESRGFRIGALIFFLSLLALGRACASDLGSLLR